MAYVISEDCIACGSCISECPVEAISEGDIYVIDKWLDRALGRPAQAVALKHSGEIGTFTAKRPSKAALAAKRAYEQELYRGGE